MSVRVAYFIFFAAALAFIVLMAIDLLR